MQWKPSLYIVELPHISGYCACQGTYPKINIKKVWELEKENYFYPLCYSEKNWENSLFWKKSKYQSRFGHPELTCLLISLLSASFDASPLQWIHSGMKRTRLFCESWMSGLPCDDPFRLHQWETETDCEISNLSTYSCPLCLGTINPRGWIYWYMRRCMCVNWQCWYHPRGEGITLRLDVTGISLEIIMNQWITAAAVVINKTSTTKCH